MVAKLRRALVLFVIFAGVVAVWLVVGTLTSRELGPIWDLLGRPSLEQAGQLGDSFGAATSLFSALGFAGVVYALILQTEERKQAAESDKESARLTLLTALVHARTAIIGVLDAEVQRLRAMDDPAKRPADGSITILDSILQQRLEMFNDEMADLFALAHYAGHETGWEKDRERYLAMLDEVAAARYAKRAAQREADHDKMAPGFGPA